MGSAISCVEPGPVYALFQAVRQRDLRTIRFRLEMDPELLTYRSLGGRDTVWHVAALGGSEAVLEALEAQAGQLRVGMYPGALNLRNDRGLTPLMYAAQAGQVTAVRWLLSRGADPWAADRCGKRTALHYAAMRGRLDCISALLDSRQSTSELTRYMDARSISGLTPLHYAVATRQPDAIQLLLERGADLRAVNTIGDAYDLINAPQRSTPLHLAAQLNSPECALALMRYYHQHLAGPNFPDPRRRVDALGRTPYRVATSRGHSGLLLELLHPSALPEPLLLSERERGGGPGVPRLATLAAAAVRQQLVADVEQAEKVILHFRRRNPCCSSPTHLARSQGTLLPLPQALAPPPPGRPPPRGLPFAAAAAAAAPEIAITATFTAAIAAEAPTTACPERPATATTAPAAAAEPSGFRLSTLTCRPPPSMLAFPAPALPPQLPPPPPCQQQHQVPPPQQPQPQHQQCSGQACCGRNSCGPPQQQQQQRLQPPEQHQHSPEAAATAATATGRPRGSSGSGGGGRRGSRDQALPLLAPLRILATTSTGAQPTIVTTAIPAAPAPAVVALGPRSRGHSTDERVCGGASRRSSRSSHVQDHQNQHHLNPAPRTGSSSTAAPDSDADAELFATLTSEFVAPRAAAAGGGGCGPLPDCCTLRQPSPFLRRSAGYVESVFSRAPLLPVAQCAVCLEEGYCLVAEPCHHRLCGGCARHVTLRAADMPLPCPVCRLAVCQFTSPVC